MFVSILFLILGFAVLLKGADWLVDGAGSLAKRAGIPQMIVGLTLVSFGTSLPEFFINIFSRLRGEADITVGNVLGSNIANSFLVLGLSAALQPLILKKSTLLAEIPFALAAILALGALLMDPPAPGMLILSRPDGFILLGIFFLFILYILRRQKQKDLEDLECLSRPYPPGRSIFILALGIVSLALGARWVVSGASLLASAAGVPSSVVGLTIVALGTVLPELATSLTAAVKKQPDIAVGNVIGSNVFNISWILGASAVLRPLPVSPAYYPDIAVIIFAQVLIFGLVYFQKNRLLTRGRGLLLASLYGFYIISLIFRPAGLGE